jgi:hypothetical protein
MYIIFRTIADKMLKETVRLLEHCFTTLFREIIQLNIGSINTKDSFQNLSSIKRSRQMVLQEVPHFLVIGVYCLDSFVSTDFSLTRNRIFQFFREGTHTELENVSSLLLFGLAAAVSL